MSDYQPYGKEWEAEFMKWAKKDLIGMIRKLCLDLGEKTYILADLEQARRQGAEEERGRCVDAVVDSTHGGALRSAVDAIRALGPIGETREETEKRIRRETVVACKNKIANTMIALSADRLEIMQTYHDSLDAIAEGKRDAQED